MSQLPELGLLASSCVVRSAIDRWANSGLPNVIGSSSFATGTAGAELVNGVKSEKRVPSATRTVPASNRPPATTSPCDGMVVSW
jgi:hypothetical protein